MTRQKAASLERSFPYMARTSQDEPDRSPPVEGIVKWYSLAKGYGFIALDEDSLAEDIFVHYSQLEDSNDVLEVGERVRFCIEDDPKGLRAVELERIDLTDEDLTDEDLTDEG